MFDSNRCVPQDELNSFVAMATYWVPYLPDIKGFSGLFSHSTFIFANGASSLIYMIQQVYKDVRSGSWPCLMFFQLKIAKISKSGWRGLEKSELPWEYNFYSRRCVALRTISLPSFIGLSCNLPEIAPFVYLMNYWIE